MQPTLELVEYLRENGTKKLEEQHRITIRAHKTYENLISLTYDQLKSDLKNPIVRQCRGIILDTSDYFKVISFPYEKFFNYCEGGAAKIDWKTARVTEKVDGSLMILYFYKDQWHISSSGTPDASGNVHIEKSKRIEGVEPIKMSELFWNTWKNLYYQLPKKENFCYVFELFTTQNIVLVRPKTDRIVLHGGRDMITFQEYPPDEIAKEMGWEAVESFKMDSLEEVLVATRKLNPMEHEGFVVCDADFNRIKVKSPAYVAIAHFTEKNGTLDRRLLEVIKTNDSEEFLGYFPEHKEKFLAKKKLFDDCVTFIETLVAKDIDLKELQKTTPEFVHIVGKSRKNLKMSVREILRDSNVKSLELLLENFSKIKR
jgi:hypothetical protein